MAVEPLATGNSFQLPLPVSARQFPSPSDSAIAWIVAQEGHVFAVDQAGHCQQASLPARWRALEISAGPDGSVWILVSDGSGGAPMLVRLAPGGEPEVVAVSIPAVKIAVGVDGTLWNVNVTGEICSLQPDGTAGRHSPPGQPFGMEISAGVDGSVWIVSTVRRYGGRVVKRLRGLPDDWVELPAPAAATKIGAAPDGMAWTVNAQGAVWRLHPSGGGNLAECQVDTACSECRFSVSDSVMREISVGPDGTVWALGSGSSSDEAALMWLCDPLRRLYRTVGNSLRPLRVAAALRRPAAMVGLPLR